MRHLTGKSESGIWRDHSQTCADGAMRSYMTVLQGQTAVTDYFTSNQLLLLAVEWQSTA